MPSGYRDGEAWVEVTRVRSRADGRVDVVCRRGARSFRAVLGRDAIVQLAPHDGAAHALARAGVAATALGRSLPLYRARGALDEDGLALAARLARLPGVQRAMPDLALARTSASFAIPPDDEHYSAQWYLGRIAVERAWRLATGARDIRVAVVDNGCDMTHPDLRDAFVGGRDVRDEDDDPSPTPGAEGNAHGTACSGIIAGVSNNGIGIAGVCPECSLHCVRLLDDGDPPLVPLSADLAAFNHALDVGAAIISNSWGFVEPIDVPELLAWTIERVARDGRGGLGAVVVFASGNDNRELHGGEITALPGVITVGAINNFDEAAPFSNRGAQVDLTAPAGTYTTDIAGPDGDDPGDYTRLFGGTSAACPVVAGVAGLVLSANPSLTSREVAELLTATARPAPYATPDADGHDLTYGYGIVDPEGAVRAALGSPAPADAGAQPEAGAAIDEHPPERSTRSEGCTPVGARASSSGLSIGALAGLLALIRARRAR